MFLHKSKTFGKTKRDKRSAHRQHCRKLNMHAFNSKNFKEDSENEQKIQNIK